MKQEFYSIDQVAELVDLHPRTVGRFIREGRLRAVRVGKKWRISERDLADFTGGSPAPRPGTVRAEDAGREEKVLVSAVAEVRVRDAEESMRMANSLFAALNCRDGEYGRARCDHVYYKEEGRARFILWGSARVVGDMLGLLAEISG